MAVIQGKTKTSKAKKWHIRKYLIPQNLDLASRLNHYGYTQFAHEQIIVNLYWVIHLICHAWSAGKTQRHSFVSIPSILLKNQLGDRNYLKCLAVLEEIGVLEKNNRYRHISQGNKENFCKSYKLTREFWNQEFQIIEVKTSKRITSKDQSRLNGIVELGIYQNIQQLQVNEDSYKAVMAKLPETKKIVAENAWNKIRNGIANVKRGTRTRRLFSTVTAIPKLVRQCLMTKNRETLVEGDLKSCFPLLLLSLYAKHKKYSSEIKLYKKALREDFYKAISDQPNEIAKKDFQRFLARSLHYKSVRRLDQKFKESFPYLYRKIASFEKKQGISLNLYLQNLEASIMIDTVGRKCVENEIFFIPIHDGFLTTDFVKVQFLLNREIYKRFKFRPTIKSQMYWMPAF
jgi:hypothetical protein